MGFQESPDGDEEKFHAGGLLVEAFSALIKTREGDIRTP